MSEETALYFQLYYGNPYISRSPWFQHALIYWDKLALIQPTHWVPRSNFNREDELEQGELLRILEPVDALKGNRADLDELFLQQVDSLESYEAKLLAAEPDRVQYVRLIATWWNQVQFDKAAEDLFWELEARKLARPGIWDAGSMHNWARNFVRSQSSPISSTKDIWTMDYRVIYLYGIYLAASMLRQEGSFVPVTDRGDDLARLARPVTSTAGMVQTLSYAAVMDVLPVPSSPISIGELIEFKRKHVTQLRELRTYLAAKLADLALASDEVARAARVEVVKYELQKDVAQLSEQMSRRNWPRIVLGGIGGLAASGLAVGAAVAGGGAALPLGLGIAAGATSIPSAVISASDSFRAARAIKGSPLAYAALTERL